MMFPLLLSICLSSQGVSEPAMVRGGVWLPRLGGTITDGGGAIDFEANIDLHNKESVPLIEFTVEPIQDIVMSLSFFDFEASGSGTYSGNDTYGGMVMANGNEWSGSTAIQSVGFEAAWEVWKPYHTGDSTTLSFAPVVGFRWFGVKTILTNNTASQEVQHQNSWIALQGGLEMEFSWDMSDTASFVDSLGINAQLLAGSMLGHDGGSMWTIQAGISLYFSQSSSAFFGYRLQELYAEDGNYIFDAGLQGLFVGGELRF
ncbi:MAG: hypothetical protein H8E83_07790 [Planctomycetes bacterium]|nr:hypothetical protein [Planctomycetota bacterium]